jgi:predicted CoA-binding protein
MKNKTVVVLGASNNPDRYSDKTLVALVKNGYRVIPVNPALKSIEELAVKSNMSMIKEPVWTLTLYVGPKRLEPMIGEILELKPQRIISNPGTELSGLKEKAEAAGIEYIEACTLVMLATGQF